MNSEYAPVKVAAAFGSRPIEHSVASLKQTCSGVLTFRRACERFQNRESAAILVEAKDIAISRAVTAVGSPVKDAVCPFEQGGI